MTKRKVRHNSRSKSQSLYMGDTFPTTLLNLNQARANDIVVDDVPRQFGGTHSLFIAKHSLSIPLQLKGIVLL
jgi:hypothetical protein